MNRSLTDRRTGLFGVVLLAGGLWAMSLAGCATSQADVGETAVEAAPDEGLAPEARAVPISSATVVENGKTFVLVRINQLANGNEVFIAAEHPTTRGKVTVHPTNPCVCKCASAYAFEVRGIPGQQGDVTLELYEQSQWDRRIEHKMRVPGSSAPREAALAPAAAAAGKLGMIPTTPLARAVPISRIESLSGTQVKAGQPVSFIAMIDKSKNFAAGDSFAVEVRATDSGTWNAPLEVLHARPIEVAIDNPRAELVYFYLHTTVGKSGKFVVRTRSTAGNSNEVTITVTQ